MQLAKKRAKVERLVENKVSFAATDAELSVYDTYEPSHGVKLAASEVLFCAMISGKKVMHVDDCNYHQAFLPQQSFVLAPQQAVYIDFPEASLQSPTSCLAIEISRDKIAQVSERMRRHDDDLIHYQDTLVHTEHNWQTQHCLSRLLHLFTENDPNRSYFIDLAMEELIARLLQQQSRDLLLTAAQQSPDRSGLHHALNYMESHLEEPLDVDKLCKLSCMSRSRFFAQFRHYLNTTPQQWLQARKLNHAKQKLKQGIQVTAVSFALGFKHPSQFSRAFKQAFNISPKAYQNRFLASGKNDYLRH